MLLLRSAKVFLEFVKECRKYDIKVPIVPGIMCTCLRGVLLSEGSAQSPSIVVLGSTVISFFVGKKISSELRMLLF